MPDLRLVWVSTILVVLVCVGADSGVMPMLMGALLVCGCANLPMFHFALALTAPRSQGVVSKDRVWDIDRSSISCGTYCLSCIRAGGKI